MKYTTYNIQVASVQLSNNELDETRGDTLTIVQVFPTLGRQTLTKMAVATLTTTTTTAMG